MQSDANNNLIEELVKFNPIIILNRVYDNGYIEQTLQDL